MLRFSSSKQGIKVLEASLRWLRSSGIAGGSPRQRFFLDFDERTGMLFLGVNLDGSSTKRGKPSGSREPEAGRSGKRGITSRSICTKATDAPRGRGKAGS